MSRILLLDENTSNRIAAGEVVERPASVIKEMCENSLDAGATALSVDIEAGGLKYIGITDNGSGIHPEDVMLSFQRHATSKIKSGDSLAAIETLGFRGEALSSIASVSKLRMKTRLTGRDMGRQIEIHAGRMFYEDDCGCPEGTSIEVRELFYNTPARLKFIKSSAPEAAAASETMLRLILANPGIAIKFSNNGKVVYHSPGTGLADAIRAVYGRDVSDHLIRVENSAFAIDISGYVGEPEISRKTRAGQTLIINGRYVKSAKLAQAVADGYGQKLMIGRFAFFVLHIALPPAIVDVNVHPQKLEIRISNEQTLWELLEKAVNNSVCGQSDIRHMQMKLAADQVSESSGKDSQRSKHENFYHDSSLEKALDKMNTPDILATNSSIDGGMILSEPKGLLNYVSGNTIPVYELKDIQQDDGANTDTIEAKQVEQSELDIKQQAVLIGQAFDTFAIVQSGDKLFYIDQHAAHERLTYDRYMAQARAADVASQQLLTPAIVKLTYDEKQIYTNNSEYFNRLGFEIDDFGTNDIALRAIPMVLGEPALMDFLRDALDALAQNKQADAPEIIEDKIIMSACKHSVKAGDKLSSQELDTLVTQLAENERLTCPHGRPVAIYITKRDLEKGFKRLV